MFCWLLVLLLPTVALAEWKVTDRQESKSDSLRVFLVTVRNGSSEAKIHAVAGRPAELRFRVLSNASRKFSSVREAVLASGGIVGVNGGYFQTDLTPVGLLVSQGEVVHPLERAKLLSGVFFVRKQKPNVVRVQHFSGVANISDAIQSGPFLVERGRTIPGLNNGRSAARTFLYSAGNGDWGFGICRSVTLAELGEILASPDLFPGESVTTALNLDGGSSTGFYLARDDQSISSSERVTVGSFLILLRN
jgi:uncharacterized protein YigE (DUF2233 family)